MKTTDFVLILKDQEAFFDSEKLDLSKYTRHDGNACLDFTTIKQDIHKFNPSLIVKDPCGNSAVYYGNRFVTRYYPSTSTVSYTIENGFYNEETPFLVCMPETVKPVYVAIKQGHNKYRRRHARRKAMLKAA